MKLFVGSLPRGFTKDDLHKLFAKHGTVASADVIIDRQTGMSKGFGFVEMSTKQEAQAAMEALNGKDVDGRTIVVNEARPREERGAPRSGGFNRR